MGTNNDEDDYMSDAFLESLCTPAPGLVTVRSITRKRTHEEVSKKCLSDSTAPREAKLREEGLQKQVDPTNKGFSLLIKMGYKPGQGLGKNAEGRQEPVPITLPEGRSGLGLATAKKEIVDWQQKLVQVRQTYFQSSMAERYRQCRIRNQLTAARNLCFQLDAEKNITVPINPDYWPVLEDAHVQPEVTALDVSDGSPSSASCCEKVLEPDIPVVPDDDSECVVSKRTVMDEDSERILEKIVRYLRRKHAFCFWCSVQYESQDILMKQCPGPTEVDHD
ncbi:hypothetical protein EG68_10132 [Paragonimus skrjabini miyazakii]|uniref:G patch domain-containing protein 11 n=1 Tax=Paragonimus skrjabini miyazakii TaxID=59628 RepID=A0A8S9YWQ4_9TREM|nr:hypothetical protein EG68_10132 [Paragonimus skrjabini miyazakii]